MTMALFFRKMDWSLEMNDGWYYCFLSENDICNVRYIHGDEAYLCNPIDVAQRCFSEGLDDTKVLEAIHVGGVTQYNRLEHI